MQAYALKGVQRRGRFARGGRAHSLTTGCRTTELERGEGAGNCLTTAGPIPLGDPTTS